MNKRFTSEAEIYDVVRTFEDAIIDRDAWKHAEHLTIALYYMSLYDTDVATVKIRNGIYNLLANGFKIELSKEMPYHETLTILGSRPWLSSTRQRMRHRS